MPEEFIWKFTLPINDEVTIEMPRHAQVLTIQVQRGTPCIWAVADPDAALEERRFYVRGTGHPMGPAADAEYVGTFQVYEGALVFHVFAEPVIAPA